ncbi:MAG: DinB family protein [Dehalococcoidia bacterium]
MPLTAEDRRLLDELDSTVRATIEALRAEDQQAAVRPGEWGLPEVVAHFLYWHDATAWGTASANGEGPAWPLPSGPDPINEASLRLRAGETVGALLDELEASHRRLVAAVEGAPDTERAAFARPSGEGVSIQRRLQAITAHWRTHLEELRG